MKKLLVIALLFALSGCAGLFDDYQQYSTTMAEHSNAESARIAAQSKEIANASRVEGATKTEAVLLSAIAMMQIERLNYTPLNIQAPTTGFAVLNTVAGHLPFAFSTYGMYRLGVSAIKNAGNITIQGEEFSVNDSFNRTETQTIGDNNATSLTFERDESTDNSVSN